MALEAGMKAPDFTLRDQSGTKRSLSEFSGAPMMVVFMPFAFTRTCEGEMCSIRDNLAMLQSRGAVVVAITCDSKNSNRVWAEEQGFSFPILSDFWPHGKVTRDYGCFNEISGSADRTTFVLDAEGVVREVISSERLDIPREMDEYKKALGVA